MDFYAPQFQNADVLGSYLRGQQAPIQLQTAQQNMQIGQQQIQQNDQELQQQPLKLAQLKLALSAQQMRNTAAQGMLGTQQQGGIQDGPQGAVSQPSGPLDRWLHPDAVSNALRADQVNAALKGDSTLEPLAKAQGIQAAQLKDQQERAKIALQPSVDELQSLLSSPAPERLVMANPDYMQAWKHYAQKLGLDPADPKNMTPQNVRSAATLAHNDLAGQSMGMIAPIDDPNSPNMTADQRGNLDIARQRLAMERQRLIKESTPSGYERDPSDPNKLRPIEGGPADPNAKTAGLDSRSGVMLQRVLSSSAAAKKSIENIMELPISTSSGWFGGNTGSTGLLGAVKGNLAQKMTGQEAQDYNVMMAGVARNLSTIETAGLAPNGSITHSMENIVLKEGDTQFTRLRKMAEMRQIVEENMNTYLANPKIPAEQKSAIKQIVGDIQQAVPFTHHDLTQLESSKNKNATIMDFAKSSGAVKQDHPAEIQSLLDKYK